ncbi:hypothetical protein CEXT_385041 [Caerostris extrusa]|uniref:Uncharacterized protein n=1 Tax=Caerostris extrusa TaxID=172846 RepID=A0AAV4QMX2_CAEEX|nr:hypothetical protein CEXT_385041 [Caerostris extrusa]
MKVVSPGKPNRMERHLSCNSHFPRTDTSRFPAKRQSVFPNEGERFSARRGEVRGWASTEGPSNRSFLPGKAPRGRTLCQSMRQNCGQTGPPTAPYDFPLTLTTQFLYRKFPCIPEGLASHRHPISDSFFFFCGRRHGFSEGRREH